MAQPHPQTPPGVQGSSRLAFWGKLAVTYGVSVLAGFGASQVATPLPYMLGPFFLWAVLSLTGIRPQLVPMGRELGQVTIGVVVGLRFTLPILLAVAALWPQMVVATVYLLAITMSAAALFAWLARTDHVTAFFATAAGGVADMAAVAQQYGGDTQSVAIVHAMRVSFVVATVPLLVFYLGTPGTMPVLGTVNGTAWLFPIVLLIAFLVARAIKALRLVPNPWLVGPIFVGILWGVWGGLPVRFPEAVIIAAQLALGTWLGSQFRREELAALPRVTLAALAVSAFLVGCALLGAVGLSVWAGLPLATAFLSLAPAAVTEMVLTAKVMNLEVEAVTAFHVLRIAIVSTTILLVFKFYMKLRGVSIEPRI